MAGRAGRRSYYCKPVAHEELSELSGFRVIQKTLIMKHTGDKYFRYDFFGPTGPAVKVCMTYAVAKAFAEGVKYGRDHASVV